MGHENIDGVNYTVRTRVVDGKPKQIYYKDGEAFIKDRNGNLQNLAKIKDGIFTQAEYVKASDFDYNKNGSVTIDEQIEAFDNEVKPFYDKFKAVFDKYGFDYNEFKNEYTSRFYDYKANSEMNVDTANFKIQAKRSNAKDELINKFKEFAAQEAENIKGAPLEDKSNELKSMLATFAEIDNTNEKWCKDILASLDNIPPARASEKRKQADEILKEDAKSMTPQFAVDEHAKPADTDTAKPISENKEVASEEDKKVFVLGQHDPSDVKEGDFAVNGEKTYQYQNGRWVRL